LNGHHIDEVLSLFESGDKPVSLYGELKKSRSVIIRDDLTMTLEDETIRLEVTYSPIRSSYSRSKKAKPQDGYIVILRDITKAKSLEEERDEFISVVSHELRTPITITEGTISNVPLMMRRPDISQDILKEAIDTAHDQVIYLSKMVNDLSTLSRAERGVADAPETIEVRGLIDDLYKEYAPQAEAKKLHFNLDLGTRLGEVNTSRLYLKELLQNFITNAIKYTREGSITLTVRREGDKITFEVSDTGIGISKSDQTKIFTKFYRSEDYRTRETSGTGLGLYVAAKLSKKLSTRIKFKSRLNHGSSFSITIPAVEEKVK
jgi:signal transduction histidine kinase